jgi:hypothetical protein
MIGQTIESRPAFPWGAVLWVVLCGALVVVALALGSAHWAIAAVFPLLVGLCLGWTREPAFVAHFTESALEVREPRTASIPYWRLEGLRAKDRPGDPAKAGPRAYPIVVYHGERALRIPASVNVPSDAIYRFLYAQFSPGGSREVNPWLKDYLAQQVATFGPNRVWSYRERHHRRSWPAQHYPRAVCHALLLSGLAWLGAGSLGEDYLTWVLVGFMAVVWGGLSCVLFGDGFDQEWSHHRDTWRQACLVISPIGLALIQGDLKGELRWDELKDVCLITHPHGFALTLPGAWAGIVLKVEGAHIVIADLYDRPLPLIYERITQYWR